MPPARRRVADPELWLALGAAASLALAAAGPRSTATQAGRTVLVVVSGGAPAAARGYRDRVDAVVGRIRSVLGAGDRLEVRIEPPDRDAVAPRPSLDALLRAAQAGRAAWRVVVSDLEAPSDPPAGLAWVAVGDPSGRNAGIVAASLRPDGSGSVLFANVQGSGTAAEALALRVDGGAGDAPHLRPVRLPADGGNVALEVPLAAVGTRTVASLVRADGGAWRDDLALDDTVAWEHRPLRVVWSEGLPPAQRLAAERALLAVLGRGGFASGEGGGDLAVTVAGEEAELQARWRLVLHPAAGPTIAAPAGIDGLRPERLVRDLTTAGVDLHYAAGEPLVPAGATLLLWRESGERAWPVIAREGRVVHFLPDPLRGPFAPARSPLWPLFVDNLCAVVTGAAPDGAAGRRREGLLDAASSRLGRAATSLDLAPLASLPPDRTAVHRSHRGALVAAASVCLLLLWIVPWDRRRRAFGGPTPVPSRP